MPTYRFANTMRCSIAETLGIAKLRQKQERPFWGRRRCSFLFLFMLVGSTMHGQTFSTLVNFDVTDGAYPSKLKQANDGNIYGTTQNGGANGAGEVYR